MPRLHALARPLVIGDPAVLERASGSGRRHATDAGPGRHCAGRGRPIPAGHPVPAGRGDHWAICRRYRPGIGRRPRRPRRIRVSDDGRRAGARRPHRRHHDPATEQTGPPSERRQPSRSHRDPGRTLRRGRSRDDALPGDERPDAGESPRPQRRAATGLGVVHVTLHVALKRVFELVDDRTPSSPRSASPIRRCGP